MAATVHLDILKEIRIASPCHMAWDDMRGDDRKRHCDACDLDVHNLSEMTRAEIEALVMNSEGRICAQIRRRLDDTIITKDCPVGLAAVRERTRRMMARTVAFASFLVTTTVLFAQGDSDPVRNGKLTQLQPFKWMHERLAPPQVLTPLGGIMACPSPPSPTLPPPVKHSITLQ